MPFRKSNYLNTTHITIAVAGIALVLNLLVMAGWIFHVEQFTRFRSDWPVMNFSIALTLSFSTFSLLLSTTDKRKQLARVLAIIIFLIAILLLCEYVFYWESRTHTYFFSNPANYITYNDSRIIPSTAISLLLLAVSLFFFQLDKKQSRNISMLFALSVFLIAVIVFVNYLYGGHIRPYNQPDLIDLSFPASVSLLLISMGILFADPEQSAISILNKTTLAAKTGRRLIIISVLVLFVLSWLQIQGSYKKLYDAEFGTVLMFISFGCSIVFVVLWGTKKLNHAEVEREKLYKLKEESEFRLNEAQQLAHLGNWELDLQKNLLTWSDEIYNIFEVSPKRFKASYETFLEVIHPEDRDRVDKAYKDSVKNKTKYDILHRLLLADGRIKIVQEHCETYYDESGNPVRSVGTVQDVTEKEKAEEKIREQTKMFIALVDTAPDATVIVNEKGIIQIANMQAVNLLGYEKKELEGKSVEALILKALQEEHSMHREKYMQDAYTRQMGSGSELTIIKKDGTEIPVEISLAPFKSQEGILITASIRDITERKKAKEKLKDSYDSIRTLTEHLQNAIEQERTRIAREIHDELGQLLVVMKMDASWLNARFGATSKQVSLRTEGLISMIDQMVLSVRRIAFELRPSILDDMGLGAAIEVQLSDIQKKGDIQIHFKQPPKEIELPETIKISLFRIVQESLTNIVRYAKAKNIMVNLFLLNDQVHLSVQDDGIGFDQKFTVGKKTLGLLGMKERVSIMGGEFILHSSPGKGTLIEITIPLVRSKE